MHSETYSEPCQTSKMQFLANIVDGFQPSALDHVQIYLTGIYDIGSFGTCLLELMFIRCFELPQNSQNGKTFTKPVLNKIFRFLTLKAPIPQNGQTHSNNLSAKADELLECAWLFCGVGTSRVKQKCDKRGAFWALPNISDETF